LRGPRSNRRFSRSTSTRIVSRQSTSHSLPRFDWRQEAVSHSKLSDPIASNGFNRSFGQRRQASGFQRLFCRNFIIVEISDIVRSGRLFIFSNLPLATKLLSINPSFNVDRRRKP
jgi:hypothetical protein